MGSCTENLYVSLSFEFTLIKIGNNSTSANSENETFPKIQISQNCTLPKNTRSTVDGTHTKQHITKLHNAGIAQNEVICWLSTTKL